MDERNLELKISILKKFTHQSDFARVLSLEENLVSRIVNGRQRPTAEQQRAMARVLGVEPEKLFRDERNG